MVKLQISVDEARRQARISLDKALSTFNFGGNTGSALRIRNESIRKAQARGTANPNVKIVNTALTSKIAKALLQKASLKAQGVVSVVNERTGNITIISQANRQGLPQSEADRIALAEGKAVKRNRLLGFGRNRPNTYTRREFLSKNPTTKKPKTSIGRKDVPGVVPDTTNRSSTTTTNNNTTVTTTETIKEQITDLITANNQGTPRTQQQATGGFSLASITPFLVPISILVGVLTLVKRR